jgi:uncharacterized membrane protein
MESTARALGHSMHPMLIVFPLGLLSTSVIFDILFLVRRTGSFPTVSYWLIAAGLVGGVLAAGTGWIDWFGIPSRTRAKRVGLWHGMTNAAVLVLFATSLYLRHNAGSDPVPGYLPLGLSLFAFGLALIGGWLGGELVERLAVAVHTGAHVDAPNSLTTEKITEPGSSARRSEVRS